MYVEHTLVILLLLLLVQVIHDDVSTRW